MIHDIDVVLGLRRSSIDVVAALGRPTIPESLDDVSAHARTREGAIICLEASKITQERLRRPEVKNDRNAQLLHPAITIYRRGSVSR